MSLHTRSLMYGKLHNGVLVAVTPTLMKRLLPVAKEMHRVITGESAQHVVPEPAVMQLLRDVEADQEYWAYKLIGLQEPTPPPSPTF